MTNQAGANAFDYESLAEHLESQLQQQYKVRDSYAASEKIDLEGARALGNFDDRAPGENPNDMSAAQFQAEQQVYANQSKINTSILDTLSQLMALNKEKKATEQRDRELQYLLMEKEIEANAKGYTTLDKNGNPLSEPRRLSDEELRSFHISKYDNLEEGEAAAELRRRTEGYFNPEAQTGKERDAIAKDLLARMDAGEQIPFTEMITAEDRMTMSTIVSLYKLWENGGEPLTGGFGKKLGRSAGETFNYLTGKGERPQANYVEKKKGFIASLRGITGDVGILTDEDAIRIEPLLPSPADTEENAIAKWQEFFAYLQTKTGIDFTDSETRERVFSEFAVASDIDLGGEKGWEDVELSESSMEEYYK